MNHMPDINRQVLLWPASFLHPFFYSHSSNRCPFFKHELTYPWIMACLLVVLLPSLFGDHFSTSMTLLLSKKKWKSAVQYTFNSLIYRLKVKWIIFIVICWWWFYHAPARTMNLYVLTGYQMNLHATHPKNID